MSVDTAAPFLFSAVVRKKVAAAFDGRRITSDGGVMLLAAAERRLGIADRVARLIADARNPLFVVHSVADILRARILAIACRYEDADDHLLHTDPGFKLANDRLPDSGRDLCSQPTVSRWKDAPSLCEVVRLTCAMVDLYCASYFRPPAKVTLDIDDTVDDVHGHQQPSLFNAHHDEGYFMPIHVYHTATSRPVAVVLRPGELEAARDAAEQLGGGAGGGERDADPCCGLGDAPSDLEQAQAQGGELGRGERLRLGDGISHWQHEPLGGGVQHKADLGGECGSATGAVQRELA